jgi:LmbE family N-acetylglucosaminyl deacetylase
MREMLHRCLATLVASAAADPLAHAQQPAAAGALPAIDSGTRLLVVAPHPDDETLCCAGVLQRVSDAGGHASVLWLTSGDGSRLTLLLVEHALPGNRAKALALGERRMREARAATSMLGVAAAGQVFLGYPDGSLTQVRSSPAGQPVASRTTGASAVPYPQALAPGHPYTGASLEHDFAQAVLQQQPTLILAPSPLDQHPDHRAAGLLAGALAARLTPRIDVRYWIVHGGEGWPSPRGLNPGVPLTPAPCAAALMPRAFELTPREEDRKLAALQAHASQMQVLGPFLLAFVRTTELFSVRGESSAARGQGAPARSGLTPAIQVPVERPGDLLAHTIGPAAPVPVSAADGF